MKAMSSLGRLLPSLVRNAEDSPHAREAAVFSVFRRAAEHPLYRIEKRPRLRAAQGQYAVIGMDGRILKRGHDLPVVLRVLEKKLIRPVD